MIKTQSLTTLTLYTIVVNTYSILDNTSLNYFSESRFAFTYLGTHKLLGKCEVHGQKRSNSVNDTEFLNEFSSRTMYPKASKMNFHLIVVDITIEDFDRHVR